jgi:hypothetical protein
MIRVTRSAMLLLSLSLSSPGAAQAIVKQEPLDGRNGATLLVDDGTCPKGSIKQVTYTHGNAMSGAPLRAAKCIPRSAAWR